MSFLHPTPIDRTAARRQRVRGGVSRLVAQVAAHHCAALLLVASLTIPDAVLHAKFYKANLILGIMHQRYFGQAAS